MSKKLIALTFCSGIVLTGCNQAELELLEPIQLTSNLEAVDITTTGNIEIFAGVDEAPIKIKFDQKGYVNQLTLDSEINTTLNADFVPFIDAQIKNMQETFDFMLALEQATPEYQAQLEEQFDTQIEDLNKFKELAISFKDIDLNYVTYIDDNKIYYSINPFKDIVEAIEVPMPIEFETLDADFVEVSDGLNLLFDMSESKQLQLYEELDLMLLKDIVLGDALQKQDNKIIITLDNQQMVDILVQIADNVVQNLEIFNEIFDLSLLPEEIVEAKTTYELLKIEYLDMLDEMIDTSLKYMYSEQDNVYTEEVDITTKVMGFGAKIDFKADMKLAPTRDIIFDQTSIPIDEFMNILSNGIYESYELEIIK
ncbi:hypothetical protein AN641_04900 [Candidatus Epulonipiscioides gigas]|nr:hypothetical protein AN641_04900 [Epulopiscium sp. SCG-C07WGA-EpuloA2]